MSRSVPAVESRSVLAVESRSVPAVESRLVPAVEFRSVPAVESRSVPAVESRSVPVVVSRSVPAVESRSVLAVVSRSVPAVESRSVPVVVSRSVPAVESRSVLAVVSRSKNKVQFLSQLYNGYNAGKQLNTMYRSSGGAEAALHLKTTEQKIARRNELKAKSTLLLAIPDEHLLKFHVIKDAKTLWEAIKTRFGGNKEYKKMTILKQQYENFAASRSESLDKTYDMFQKLISQLKIHVNSAHEVFAANSQGQAFASTYADDVMFSFFANQSNSPQLDNEELEHIDTDDLEEMDLKWQVAMLTMRVKRFIKKIGSSSSSDTEVNTCSKECLKSYQALQKQYDQQCEILNKANIEIIAYQLGLESLEARIVVHHKNEVVFKEDIAFLKYEVKVRDNFITEPKNQLEESLKEKDDLKLKLKKFETSSKNLTNLINSQISPKDKTGLGYDSQLNERDLNNKSDVFESASDSSLNKSKEDNNQATNRYKAGEGYHAVPPPYIGNFMPLRPDLSFVGLDDSIFKFAISETVTSVHKTKTSASKTSKECIENPKSIRPSAPIIKDWEFDCDDDCDIRPLIEQNKPSHAKINFVKSDENTKKFVIKQHTYKQAENLRKSHNSRSVKRNWNGMMTQKLRDGTEFKKKACFVCGSLYHLIKDCKVPVNTAKQSSLRAAASTSTARYVNTAATRPIMNGAKPSLNVFHKSHSLVRRAFNQRTAPKNSDLKETINTAKGNPQYPLQDQRIFDSGCSRHMKGNKSFLTDYKEIDGGFVAFGESPKGDKISRKGKIRTGKLNFEDVYFVKELKFNLFSVLQMCDKKNSVLFTETECLVLSPDFKLLDENQVLLKVPRQNNMYSFDLNNVAPLGGIEINVNAWQARQRKASDHEYILLPFMPSHLPLSLSIQSSDDKDADEAPGKGDEGVSKGSGVNNQERFDSSTQDVNTAKPSINTANTNINTGSLNINFVGSNDPSIPSLKEIDIFDDVYNDREVGVEADANNLGLSTVVSPIPTIRVHKDHPKEEEQIIKIIRTAYLPVFSLNGNAKRNKARLVAQGYTQEECIDYEEVFAPVVRIEAIRLFFAYASFMGFIVYQMDVKSAFLYGTIEEEVYVKQKDDGIFISQDKYVADILKKFNFAIVKTASTPIEPNKALIKDAEAKDVDVHLYRSMIGSLMYLTASSPDIMFAVCTCARFQVTPKTSCLHAMKRIFRYLKGQPKLGLWYLRDSLFDLKSFFNSDYAGASLNKKSITGVITSMLVMNRGCCCITIEEIVNAVVLDIDVQIRALVDGKKIIITEASIRRDLRLDDVEGTACLPNADIFEELARMGAKTTAWNEFNITMASAIIYLANNPKFNFTKYIFDNMVKNLEAGVKFYMFLRFVQMFVNHQLGEIPIDTQDTPILTQPSSSQSQRKHKSKRKQRKEIKVPHTEPQPEEHIPTPSHDSLLSVKKLEGKKKKRTHGLKRLYKVGLTARVESFKEEEDQGRMNDEDLFGVNDPDGDELIMDVTASENVEQDATVIEKEVSAAANEVVTTVESIEGITAATTPQFFKDDVKLAQTLMEIKAAKPKAKEMKAKIKEEERIAREKNETNRAMIKEWDDVQATIDVDRQAEKMLGDSSWRCDDDVTIEATPLASKSLTIVDYKIYKEGKKSYFKRADENTQNYLTFGTMFKNFNREDLEVLRSIVKEKFKNTKPVNNMDNLLFQTLKTIFEHHVKDNIWKYQQGEVKVYNWKLYDSCGVYCVTTQNMVYYLLVEKMYPFTNNILHQLWNDVRLQVNYVVEMAYDLFRLIKRQINEGYIPA
uniref:Uncharacterized protein n=1 Tax=Tanacetum cinerariifolium TaxID=118510 RepID=A0A6L2M506_TANCI|nr:hypothetical protein [Tanacetum cinerariifolium]